jgi:hypothetical protein
MIGFLSLAVVFAPLPTLGVRHSHEGGEQAHRHDGHIHHGIPALDIHCHHACDDGAGEEIASNPAHVHFFWLGLDLSHQPGNEDENQSNAPEGLFTVPLGGQAVTHFWENCMAFQTLEKVVWFVWQAVPEDGHVPLIYRAQTQPPASLCDVARGERSGVLVV